MSRNSRIASAIFAASILGVTGCGSSGNDSPEPQAKSSSESTPKAGKSASMSPSPKESTTPSPSPSATMAAVTIEDFAYKGPGRVSPGDKIDVTNEDSSSHTLTSDQAGEFDVTVEADGAADFAAPAKPGTYPYHCTFHGDMSGTLVVG